MKREWSFLRPALAAGALVPLSLFAQAGEGSAPPPRGTRIERIAWGGWDEAYRLSNGEVELIVVPAVSRILHYGLVGGDNLLWRNSRVAGRVPAEGEWANYGGSKPWIWPQDDWQARTGRAWPPPTDAAATLPSAAAIVDERTLRLSSRPISGYGLTVAREIRLADHGTRVESRSSLSNTGRDTPYAVAAWTVAQLPADGTLFARLSAGARPDEGYRRYTGSFAAVSRNGRDILVVERRPDQGGKIGMDADLLAWQRNDLLYVERCLDRKTPPAQFRTGERAQIYSHPDGDATLPPGVSYVELELTSPLRKLRAGEVVTLASSFEILRLSPEEQARDAVADKLRGM